MDEHKRCGNCTQRRHTRCNGRTRWGLCGCVCVSGGITDTRTHGATFAGDTLQAVAGARGTVAGIGFAYSSRCGEYHIERARERRESLLRNGRYFGRERGIERFATRVTAPSGALTVATGDAARERIALAESRIAHGRAVRGAEYGAYVEAHAHGTNPAPESWRRLFAYDGTRIA